MFEKTLKAFEALFRSRFDVPDVVIDRLATEAPATLMIYSASAIDRSIDLWKTHLPTVRPFYAVKCNPQEQLLKRLASSGVVGFDCASAVEIETVAGLVDDPSKDILYANTIKSREGLRVAGHHNVRMVTVDCVEELEKLTPSHKILIRIRHDDPWALRKLGSKFGCDPLDVPDMLAKAKKRNLDIAGIAFHVGSGLENPMALYDGIEKAHHVAALARTYGFQIAVLDIGGGFRSIDEDKFTVCAKAINAGLDRYFPTGVAVVAEPGRFFAEASSTLYVRVDGVRRSAGGTLDVFLADGTYGHFGLLWKIERPPPPRVVRVPKGAAGVQDDSRIECRLCGPTCDGEDVVMTIVLPKPRVGDYLAFDAAGAYTAAASTRFNGFDVSKDPSILL